MATKNDEDNKMQQKSAKQSSAKAWLLIVTIYLASFVPAYLIFGDLGVIVLVALGGFVFAFWLWFYV